MSIQNNNTSPTSQEAVANLGSAAATSVDEMKQQALQAAHTAKSGVDSLAFEARDKINEAVDRQKSAGADQLSEIAQAAVGAAGELEQRNPQVARLVRDAASSVEQFAGNLRNHNIRDVIGAATDLARQQPVAFFAGSVLAGFVFARFLKSDAQVTNPSTPASRDQETRPREWSEAHLDSGTV
jgi:acyl-CoA reductase-like NAD-dependent aldehyde dehydrogenase